MKSNMFRVRGNLIPWIRVANREESLKWKQTPQEVPLKFPFSLIGFLGRLNHLLRLLCYPYNFLYKSDLSNPLCFPVESVFFDMFLFIRFVSLAILWDWNKLMEMSWAWGTFNDERWFSLGSHDLIQFMNKICIALIIVIIMSSVFLSLIS